MLSVLRHKGVSRKVLWVVAVIIILSFGVFGTAYRLDNSVNSAGKIFGKSVSLRNFEHAYLDARDQAIIRYGDRFFKNGQSLDLEGEAWSRLILSREVQKRRIKVSDKEVVDFIATLPFFQRDGKFDQFIYTSIVSNPRIFDRPVKDFEAGIRGQLAIKKLLVTAIGNITVTDDDLRKEFIRRNEKIKLSYVLFSPADYSKGLTASDEETQKFYAEHKEDFGQAPMVNVQYVHLMYPDKATDAQKADVKKKALAIGRELTPQADLSAIATKYQTQAKDSGFFTQEQPLLTFAWSPDLIEKLFAMKVGESSPALEAPDGWQVIKIKEKQAASTPQLAQIADQVKSAVIAQKSFTAAQAKADESLKTIKQQITEKDLKEVTTTLGLKIDETGLFARGEYINAPGLIAEFQQESLNLNAANKLSGVVATSQGPAILYLSETNPVDEKQFANDKEDFRQMVEAQRRNQAMSQFMTKLKFEANIKIDTKNKIRYK